MAPKLAIGLGALSLGFAPVFVALASTPPTLTGFYRCALAFLMLAPFANWKKILKTPRRSVLLVAAGMFFGADLVFWHRSVLYCGVGLGTVLANTQVVFVSLIGWIFFKEKLNAKLLFAMALAGLGVVLCLDTDELYSKPNFLIGGMFGLVAGFFYSLYICLLRGSHDDKTIIVDKVFLTSLGAAAICFVVALFEGSSFTVTKQDVPWLLLLTFVTQIGGWLWIAKYLPRVPLSTTGIILLLQPVFATLLGYIIFGETLVWIQYLGCALTLLGVGMLSAKK